MYRSTLQPTEPPGQGSSLSICFHSLLDYRVPAEKSGDDLVGFPLQVTVVFSLAAVRILSLSVSLDSFNTMCFGEALFRLR